MKKGYISVFGYFLFVFGALGIILSLVGLQITGLAIIDKINPLIGFVVKMILMVFGIILLFFAKTPQDPELLDN